MNVGSHVRDLVRTGGTASVKAVLESSLWRNGFPEMVGYRLSMKSKSGHMVEVVTEKVMM